MKKLFLILIAFVSMIPAFSSPNAEMPTAYASGVINSLLPQATAYMTNKGFSNQEIIDDFGSLQSPGIVYVYLAAQYIERNPDNFDYDASDHIVDGGGGSGPEAYNCVLETFGIMGIAEVLRGNVTKSALSAAARKFATRTLGVVGAVWALYDFANCMGWVGIVHQELIDVNQQISINNYNLQN